MSFNFTASLDSQFLGASWIFFLIMKGEKKSTLGQLSLKMDRKLKKSHAHTHTD